MKHNFAKLYFWSTAYTYSYLANSRSRVIANLNSLSDVVSHKVTGSLGTVGVAQLRL